MTMCLRMKMQLLLFVVMTIIAVFTMHSLPSPRLVMRRCVQHALIVSAAPATSPPGASFDNLPDAAAFPEPFSCDSRMWRVTSEKKTKSWITNKRASYFSRVANIFSAASDELKPLPVVDDVADSHIIRAAHVVGYQLHSIYIDTIVFLRVHQVQDSLFALPPRKEGRWLNKIFSVVRTSNASFETNHF